MSYNYCKGPLVSFSPAAYDPASYSPAANSSVCFNLLHPLTAFSLFMARTFLSTMYFFVAFLILVLFCPFPLNFPILSNLFCFKANTISVKSITHLGDYSHNDHGNGLTNNYKSFLCPCHHDLFVTALNAGSWT